MEKKRANSQFKTWLIFFKKMLRYIIQRRRSEANTIHTEFFSCAPDPKLKSPAGIGRTLESTIGSNTGSVGISWTGDIN